MKKAPAMEWKIIDSSSEDILDVRDQDDRVLASPHIGFDGSDLHGTSGSEKIYRLKQETDAKRRAHIRAERL